MQQNLPALFPQNGEMHFREINGEFCLSAEQIGLGLGYSEPADAVTKLYSRYKDELEPFSLTVNLTVSAPPSRVFTEEGIYIISMLARTPAAKEFRKKVAGLLKGLRQQKLTLARREAAESALMLKHRLDATGKTDDFLKKLKRYQQIGLNNIESGKLLDVSTATIVRYKRLLKRAGLWEV